MVRRGYDPLAVQKYLMAIAAELRTARDKQRELEARAAAAETRAAELEEITPSKLTSLLGEETMRVLDAANTAASDIRSKAEENVARLLREAQDQAAELRREAEAVLAVKTDEAKAAADEIRAEILEVQQKASVDAAAMVEAGRLEGREMVTEAQRVRERMLRDLARRRKGMRQQIDQLQAGRDRLVAAYDVVRETLDIATAELEIAVPEARLAAEAAYKHDDATLDRDVSDLSAELDRLEGAEDLPDEPDAVAEPKPEMAVVAEPPVDVQVDPEVVAEPEPEPEPEIAVAVVTEPEADVQVESPDEPVVKAVSIFARIKTGDADTAAPAATSRAGTDEAPETDAAPDGAHDQDDPVVVLLSRRDEALAALERSLAKRIKRELSDEQNELLDAVRRGEVSEVDALLPAPETQVERYVTVVAPILVEAAEAGVAFVGAPPRRKVKIDVSAPAEDLAAELIGPLRDRLVRGFSAADGDADEASERIRSCFREWKTQRVDGAASHAALTAFNAGLYDAIASGAKVHWIVDDGDTASPDCDDNALAGNLVKGEDFPTGHRFAPAHPSCRCLVVPVDL